MKSNIVLVGMPSSGKSTVGVRLARALGMPFVDTDDLLREKYAMSLADLIERDGEDAFLACEGDLLASLAYRGTVIATGGSAVYSKQGMEHLSRIAKILYLELPLSDVSERVGNLKTRGVILHGNHSLSEMYGERCPLYRRYADLTVPVGALTEEESLAAILEAMKK